MKTSTLMSYEYEYLYDNRSGVFTCNIVCDTSSGGLHIVFSLLIALSDFQRRILLFSTIIALFRTGIFVA